MKYIHPSPSRGFTIIEILIAVAVVAIVLIIAIPSYQYSISKGNRSIAISDINNIAQALEQYYSYNRKYTNNFTTLGITASPALVFEYTDPTGKYNYQVSIPRGEELNTVNPQGALTDDAKADSYIIYAYPMTNNNSDNLYLSQNDLGVQRNQVEGAGSGDWNPGFR